MSLYLELLFGKTDLGSATGFVVTRENSSYLVTNWHVLSGRDPQYRKVMHDQGAIPDRVRIRHLVSSGEDTLDFEDRVESLFDADSKPLWLEHPVHHSKIDVAVLPLTQLEGVHLEPYDPWQPHYIELGVGDDLSVVGFPFGANVNGLALWTHGYIASEYEADYEDLPCFLIDARTRSGQSGSPAIVFKTGGYLGKFGGLTMPQQTAEDVQTPGQPIVPGRRPKVPSYMLDFLGVYSGRLNAESDLGFVWKPSAVREIIDARILGGIHIAG